MKHPTKHYKNSKKNDRSKSERSGPTKYKTCEKRSRGMKKEHFEKRSALLF